MKTIICILILVVWVGTATAQCPDIGQLCDSVAEASVGDFWTKWNTAELVVYGTPMLAQGCLDPDVYHLVGSYDGPQPGSCGFTLITHEIWKGADSLSALSVGTSWEYNSAWQMGPMPGYILWGAESCALTVAEYTKQVFFLRQIDDQWETYTCFGTGVYDRLWLVAEIGTPVPVSASSWGSLKATYR